MNIILPKLEKYQREVIDYLDGFRRRDIIAVCKAQRQMGKSTTIFCLLINEVIKSPGSTSIMMSLTYKNLREIFRLIIKNCERIIKNSSQSTNTIEFINGSRIIFLSANQGENIRGFTVSGILCIDEAAYIKDEIILNTMAFCNTFSANIILFSTPRFKSGLFYTYFTQEGVKVFDWSKYKNPFITEEKLEIIKKTMPLNLFRADYLGLWMEMNSDVFGDFSKIIKNKPYNGEKVFVGIDFGTGDGKDYTSISVFNNNGEQVGLRYFNDKKDLNAVEEILSFLSTFNIEKCLVEKNSIGSVFSGLLKRRASFLIQEFNTTNDSKRKIIDGLVEKINKGEITLLDDMEQKIQFSSYEIQKTATGKITYNAANGFHDDIIMSDALCLEIMKKGNYKYA